MKGAGAVYLVVCQCPWGDQLRCAVGDAQKVHGDGCQVVCGFNQGCYRVGGAHPDGVCLAEAFQEDLEGEG